MLSEHEVYFSIDIETAGPCLETNGIMSLGAVAFRHTGVPIGRWYQTFFLNERQRFDPKTRTEFWDKHPHALAEALSGRKHLGYGMCQFVAWVDETAMEKRPVCVAYPAGFDYSWVHTLAVRYACRDPFGFACLDMKTLASSILNLPFTKTWKGMFPREWYEGLPRKNSHIAVDDAENQGRMFFNMVAWGRKHNNT